MVFRRVNITRDENVADQGHLQRHPNVRNYIHFPWGYTLFEFYDPIFESVDPGSPHTQGQSEEARARLAALMSEERRLLWPIYKGRPARWQGNQLGLFLKTGVYRVLDKRKTDWPWFGSSPGWECESKIKIIGRVRSSNQDSHALLGRVLDEWRAWATSSGRLAREEHLDWHGELFSVLCTFKDLCCDSCIGLYLLLAKTRKETLLEAVGFFLPEDSSPKFYEIGGTGIAV